VAVAEERVTIEQTRQIVHVDELCNECGNCATFCVHPGEPFRDKPRFFLDPSAFEAEPDNAYRIESKRIRRRDGGQEIALIPDGSGYEVRTDALCARLSADGSITEEKLVTPFEGRRSLRAAIELLVLDVGLRGDAQFLIDASERFGGGES